MSSVTRDLSRLLVRDLEGMQREIALYPDDERLWEVLPGITNSAGNLALHVAGNVQHFIGAALGHTGYIRNRESEFATRSGTRRAVVAELDRAIAVAREVLPQLSESDLQAPHEPQPGLVMPRQRLLLHLCTHASFHLGQVGYLRRALMAEAVSTNSVTASRVAEPVASLSE